MQQRHLHKPSESFKCQRHKMVKYTQTIRRHNGDKLSVFEHFGALALKGLMKSEKYRNIQVDVSIALFSKVS